MCDKLAIRLPGYNSLLDRPPLSCGRRTETSMAWKPSSFTSFMGPGMEPQDHGFSCISNWRKGSPFHLLSKAAPRGSFFYWLEPLGLHMNLKEGGDGADRGGWRWRELWRGSLSHRPLKLRVTSIRMFQTMHSAWHNPFLLCYPIKMWYILKKRIWCHSTPNPIL